MDTSMERVGISGRTLGVLAILICLGGVMAVAALALRYLDISPGSLVIGTVLVAVGIAVVNVLLVAVDNWLEQTQSGADRKDRGTHR
jgi:hypothetical protein